MTPEHLRGIGEGVFLFALCHILARVEIHIEGAHGWAVNLPTWRWGPKWWLQLTNGKELTGYHVWLTLFLIGMFHLPLVFGEAWRETGMIVQILVPLHLARFVVVPVAQTLNVTGRQHLHLVASLLGALALLASFALS